ncbi:hypothetical protein ACIF83_19805 [Streptomyces sp. NPDC085866]|uniref:hypothetical protein n=1 Tax=Streptomyces sp. NPDC085866 TaxID=3365736 RepID=UPI0037D1C295
MRDDEDPRYENENRVLRLVRGILTEDTEQLPSPCIPTPKDPFTGWDSSGSRRCRCVGIRVVPADRVLLTSGTCPSPPRVPPPHPVPPWCGRRRPP